jgi:hypothetical protein
MAASLSAAQFHAAANQSQGIRDLIVRYNDLLLAQIQQSVASNALHTLETRLSRWLLQSARLIRYRRGHIQILDRAALEDIACECYAVLRQNADKVFTALRPSS